MPNEKKSVSPKSGETEENKILAAISYLWFISIVVLLLKKDNEFVQFHAKQGLILFIISIILWLIPFIGWMLNIIVFIFIIIGFIKAMMGEKWKLPLLADLAAKMNL